jgi:hypothetical protein
MAVWWHLITVHEYLSNVFSETRLQYESLSLHFCHFIYDRASLCKTSNGHNSPMPMNMLTSMSPPPSSAPDPPPPEENPPEPEHLHRTRFASKVFEAPALSRDDFTPEEVSSYWWSRREIFLFELKKDDEEEWDIRNVLPAHVIKAIAVFLKTGLGVWGTLFVVALFSVMLETVSKAILGRGLPEPASNFIVQSVRPNIVTALLVLVGFYVTESRFPAAKAKM